jgi:hypothetical protein
MVATGTVDAQPQFDPFHTIRPTRTTRTLKRPCDTLTILLEDALDTSVFFFFVEQLTITVIVVLGDVARASTWPLVYDPAGTGASFPVQRATCTERASKTIPLQV